ncbi:hypothetical protein KKR91_06995 [Arthrobacter jiangjiafuii]|uniref:Uncharacterized protein n=1 Tax=Arthrobacter jiangjiafuii TaxID=2817475 RepID=A0A975M7B6_9MICC|nr:hypothetical protein [Arthrobacter jiangjiafuii]MBP3044351.1 hypothetical protein [Arthrobacter jiangjiafuii]QWC11303.1 hypothetical protein KKR91_06995 [Arthrobacter jiangjiafuii]
MTDAPQPSDEKVRAALAEMIAGLDPTLAERLEHDVESHLELIALTNRGAREMEQLLQSSVTSARLAGASWERIGQRLGMSRQAAQQRFGRVPAEEGTGDTLQRRRLTPVTAFDEMEALAEAGRQGWHSVGYGAYFHDLVRSSEQWEHLRVPAFGSGRRGLEKAGWQKIGTLWFPWAYYARPTGKPVEDETKAAG